MVSDFDLHFDAAGEFELHQSVDGFGRRVVDVDEALVARELELFARFLVDEGRTVDGEDALVGRQGYRAAYHCVGSLHGLDNLFGTLVDKIVVIRLKFDANFLVHIVYWLLIC